MPSAALSWRCCRPAWSVSRGRKADRVTTWLALFILAFAAVMLVADESGMIAGLDSTTFGYVAVFLALIVYLGGGMLGDYRGRVGTLVRDAVVLLALCPVLGPLLAY